MILLDKIYNVLDPAVEGLGYDLVDVEYLTEGGRKLLRVYIDKDVVGVNIDDCVKVTREISPILDVEDLIGERYSLEVSSPGAERAIRKDKDFQKAIGKKITVKTREPVNGRQNFKVILKSFNDKEIVVTDTEENDWLIERVNIGKAKLKIEF